jgi:superfamily II DNA or RNA helicase
MQAIEETLRAIREGKKSGLWVMPTGTGKTRTFTSLATELKEPTLAVVHRDELARQTEETFKTVWPEATVSRFPESGWEQAKVVIATVQCLKNRVKKISPDRFGLVIVDEAHHGPALSWVRVVKHFTPKFLLGCTATPDRIDEKDLGELFGYEVLYEYPLRQAMEEGRLVPLRQHVVFTDVSLEGISLGKSDFARTKLGSAVKQEARNHAVLHAYQQFGEKRPTLIFAVDLEHVVQLHLLFKESGVAVNSITGTMDLTARRQILGDFRQGVYEVLINCEVLTEGFDEQRIGCIIMARPTLSRGLYQQCVGRGLRLDSSGNKTDCCLATTIPPADDN